MAFARVLPRSLMVLVGLSVLAFYLLVAWAGYQLLAILWAVRPDSATLVAMLGGLTVLSGYLSYRFGTARLLARSRRREYAADDRAAVTTGKPLALARALRKIQRYAEPRWGLLSLLNVGNDEDQWSRMLSTHPSTEERIERLVEKADGRNGHGRVNVHR